MPPIDASIPLSIQPPKTLGPEQLLSLQTMMRQGQLQDIQIQEAKRKQQEQVALKDVFQQYSDPQTGMLSNIGLSEVSKINPVMGMEFYQKQHDMVAKQVADRLKKLEVNDKQTEQLAQTFDSLYTDYQNTAKRVPTAQAKQEFLKNLNEKADEAEKTGLYTPAQIDGMRKVTDPEKVPAFISGTKAHRDYLQTQAAGMTPFQKELKTFEGMKPTDPGYAEMKKRIAKETAPTQTMLVQPGAFEGKNGELMAALAEKGVTLPAGFRSKQQQVALLNSLRERNPNLSADEIAEKVKTGQIDLATQKKVTQVAAGIAGRVAYAEQEILQTVPLVREASRKLPRGQFVPWNKLKQMGQEKFSNPDLAEFNLYMTSLSNAYDLLAARGGTDVQKRAEARKNFDTAPSPEALERVMQAVINEARASGRAATASMKAPGSFKETEKSVSKSGKPIHKNAEGQWEYD